jgi:hypothetical protein
MTRDGTVGRSDATERSLPLHWDIDPVRVMRPRLAHPIRASSPSGLREQAGHMTASDFCAAREVISCQAGASTHDAPFAKNWREQSREPAPRWQRFGHRCAVRYRCLPSVRGHLMSEKAKETRPLEVVWVALFSVLLLMLMMFSVDVPAR